MAVLSVFLIAALLFVQLRSPSAVTAAELLRRSSAAEENLASRADQVVHRTLNLEERRASDKTLISRKRIDIWRNLAQGVKARRVYDEKNRLVAGQWTRADSSRLVYRQGGKLQAAQSQDGAGTALTFDAIWQLEPMAKDFAALTGGADRARVEEQANTYAISYESEIGRAKEGLQKAILVLNRDDLHTIEQTLVIREGDEAREFRFVEASFERRLASTVAPAVFEPEPALLGSDGAAHSRGDRAMSAARAPASLAIATAELEVEALRLLNQVGANLDDQASVTRTADGSLRISGLVETAERKAEILRALEPIANQPAVRIEVETVAEAMKRKAQRPAASEVLTLQQVEVQQSRIPVYEELRQYLAPREGQADEEISRFAARMLGRSRQALSHAGTLKQLAGRFSEKDLLSLSPEAREKWLGVIRAHARACEQEVKRLRQELQPIFPTNSADEGSEEAEITSDADLIRAAGRLFDLMSANDRAVRSAFTISTETGAIPSLKSQQFWHGLPGVERLAARINQVH